MSYIYTVTQFPGIPNYAKTLDLKKTSNGKQRLFRGFDFQPRIGGQETISDGNRSAIWSFFESFSKTKKQCVNLQKKFPKRKNLETQRKNLETPGRNVSHITEITSAYNESRTSYFEKRFTWIGFVSICTPFCRKKNSENCEN